MAIHRIAQQLRVSKRGQRIAFSFKLPETAKRVVEFDAIAMFSGLSIGQVTLSVPRYPNLWKLPVFSEEASGSGIAAIAPDENWDYDINGPVNGRRNEGIYIGAKVYDTLITGLYLDLVGIWATIDYVYFVYVYLTYET